MDEAFVTHLIRVLADALSPALLSLLVACGAGSLLLRVLDGLPRATASHARLPLVMTALFAAVGLWTVPLLALLMHWPPHDENLVVLMTVASFGWSLAVAALWCVLGGRATSVRAVLLGALLSLSGPVAVLLVAGTAHFAAMAWADAGLLGIVMVLSAVACAAALQLALSPRPGAAGAPVRRPAVSVFVCALFGAALTVNAACMASLSGTFSAARDAAPAWLRVALAVGAVASVLAALLLGYRDRAAADVAAASAARDMRLRKEAMQALNDLEQSYRQREAELAARHQLLLDGVEVGLWEFDLVTRSAQFSARFADMLGYTLKEIGPSTSEYLRLVHPDDLPMVLNRIQAHVDGNTAAYVAEFRMRHKDGGYRHVRAHGVAWRDAGGRAARMAGSHVEIAVQAAAEPGPRASEPAVTPEAWRRQGLWETWSPIEDDHAAAAPAVLQPVAASGADAALPSINPHALR
ncbi:MULTISPECIES: PAS domain-containing protein [Ralstonia]|uniref:PAS domain-containing protein n=1 Tax=Ralstonia TaxID=48736 RepID=UPI000A557927|nr:MULTISPECIES: PAS domain-containing protein [Ralstonia]PLT17238.1 histidine kinase [Ralstonia mannitolilytica]